jgi:hypothetical protein
MARAEVTKRDVVVTLELTGDEAKVLLDYCAVSDAQEFRRDNGAIYDIEDALIGAEANFNA